VGLRLDFSLASIIPFLFFPNANICKTCTWFGIDVSVMGDGIVRRHRSGNGWSVICVAAVEHDMGTKSVLVRALYGVYLDGYSVFSFKR
jgi:hypothetical protein